MKRDANDKTWKFDSEANTLTVHSKELDRSNVYSMSEVHADVRDQVFAEGVKKKMADSGGAKTPQEAFDGYDAIFDNLKNGVFNAPGGGGAPTIGAHIQVIAELTQVSVPAAQRAWGKLDDTARTAFKVKYADQIKEVQARNSKEEAVDLSTLI